MQSTLDTARETCLLHKENAKTKTKTKQKKNEWGKLCQDEHMKKGSWEERLEGFRKRTAHAQASQQRKTGLRLQTELAPEKPAKRTQEQVLCKWLSRAGHLLACVLGFPSAHQPIHSQKSFSFTNSFLFLTVCLWSRSLP